MGDSGENGRQVKTKKHRHKTQCNDKQKLWGMVDCRKKNSGCESRIID